MGEGKLTPMPRNQLSQLQMLAWRYAQFTCDNICKHFAIDKVLLKVASTLPKNTYEMNAFRRSFYYDGNNTLWIRLSRYNQASELLVVIAHCIAHIANKDDFDDNDAEFVKKFYIASNILSSEVSKTNKGTSVLEAKVEEASDVLLDEKLRRQVDREQKLEVGFGNVRENKWSNVVSEIDNLTSLDFSSLGENDKNSLKSQLKTLHKKRKDILE